MKSPLRTTVPGESPSAWRAAIFSTSVRPIQTSAINYSAPACASSVATVLLLRSALAEQLGNIEINEISVMKNDRFDRALHFVTLVTVRGDDVQDFAGNAVLVSECDAT